MTDALSTTLTVNSSRSSRVFTVHEWENFSTILQGKKNR
jgi:hypothetical protein